MLMTNELLHHMKLCRMILSLSKKLSYGSIMQLHPPHGHVIVRYQLRSLRDLSKSSTWR